jgi:hypothetical protein
VINIVNFTVTIVRENNCRKNSCQRTTLTYLLSLIAHQYAQYGDIATKMSMTFEPRLSTSVMRAPFSSADAPSMADSLPSINFGFDDLRDRMAKFTVKFDNFIEQGRKRVLEERNQFRMNVAELKGRRRTSMRTMLILMEW